MEVIAHQRSAVATRPVRVLVVADWTVDASEVVRACLRRAERDHASFAVIVPAWLHGLGWVGDPTASAPCARRQIESIQRLAAASGLEISSAGVGDPDPISAIADALDDDAADEIVVFTRVRRFGAPHPLDLAHRAHRITGLPVRRLAVPAASLAGAPAVE
jgi:hypothetical protein